MSDPFVYSPLPPAPYDIDPSQNPFLFSFHWLHLRDILPGGLSPKMPLLGPKTLIEDSRVDPNVRHGSPSCHPGTHTALPETVPFDEDRWPDTRAVTGYHWSPHLDPHANPPGSLPTPPVTPRGHLHPSTNSPPAIPGPVLYPLLQPRSGTIQFDLSNLDFRPLLADGKPIPSHILAKVATFPPTKRLVINSDEVPHFNVTIDFNESAQAFKKQELPFVPPVSVGDVLYAIHQTMRKPETKEDRDEAKLTCSENKQVSDAFRVRYHSGRFDREALADEGARTIDHFREKVMFAGLLMKDGDEGFEGLKLLVE
jgi:hypothetical protein